MIRRTLAGFGAAEETRVAVAPPIGGASCPMRRLGARLDVHLTTLKHPVRPAGLHLIRKSLSFGRCLRPWASSWLYEAVSLLAQQADAFGLNLRRVELPDMTQAGRALQDPRRRG
jgi:hypothetical protein